MAVPPCSSMCGTAHSHISFRNYGPTAFGCQIIIPIILPISPSYDLAHLADLWLDFAKQRKLAKNPPAWLDGECVQGAGTYSPLESTCSFSCFCSTAFVPKDASESCRKSCT